MVVVQAMLVVLLPTSFFFNFLYYTDIGALTFFLASYWVFPFFSDHSIYKLQTISLSLYRELIPQAYLLHGLDAHSSHYVSKCFHLLTIEQTCSLRRALCIL